MQLSRSLHNGNDDNIIPEPKGVYERKKNALYRNVNRSIRQRRAMEKRENTIGG